MDYFRKKNVDWLRLYLKERGIQTSSNGKGKRKGELVDLAYGASTMKLPKLEDISEYPKVIHSEVLATESGPLPKIQNILNWTSVVTNLPDVTFPDICNYLIGKSPEYSEENLKSFKSLQGYRLFKDGHVVDIKIHNIKEKNHTIMKFKVQPTERSTTFDGKTTYDGYVVVKSDGTIHGAFCPCQGGADGTCRHVAAVLFDIEFTVHNNNQVTATSQECKWKRRSKPNENACSLNNLKICKAEYGKKDKTVLKPVNFDPRSIMHDPKMLMEQLRDEIQQDNSSAVFLQLLPIEKSLEITQEQLLEAISSNNIDHEEEVSAVEVQTIQELRDLFLSSLGLDNMDSLNIIITEELCTEFNDFIKLDHDQITMIFDKTTSQENSEFWMNQRIGRLTASNFYRICHLRDSTDKHNILKDLFNYCPLTSEKQPPQFAWGHAKEVSAAAQYLKKMKKHQNVSVSRCGFVIDPSLCHLGASPDRIRYCKCCGKTIVEIKSIYSRRSMLPHIAAASNIYKDDRGTYLLKKETMWYYQIQGEMALSQIKKADLVIYTNKGIMVIDVKFDKEVWEPMVQKLNLFWHNFMIRELFTQEIKQMYPYM